MLPTGETTLSSNAKFSIANKAKTYYRSILISSPHPYRIRRQLFQLLFLSPSTAPFLCVANCMFRTTPSMPGPPDLPPAHLAAGDPISILASDDLLRRPLLSGSNSVALFLEPTLLLQWRCSPLRLVHMRYNFELRRLIQNDSQLL